MSLASSAEVRSEPQQNDTSQYEVRDLKMANLLLNLFSPDSKTCCGMSEGVSPVGWLKHMGLSLRLHKKE